MQQNLQNLPEFKFKKDGYARSRGAPEMLVIHCAQCHQYIMHYQKDGPGPLLRCYLDRIHYPIHLKDRQDGFDKRSAEKLACPACKVVIGTPIIYKPENRPAYHLRPGFFGVQKT